jgi:phosphohistidine phosphatase
MRLHLLRHAKTNNNSKSGNDIDRRLHDRGKIQANEMGVFLKGMDNLPSLALSSDATRTRETVKLIQNHSVFEQVNYLPELYLIEQQDFLEFIWNLEGGEDIFIVGHNNGISEIASYFLEKYLELKTCEYIVLEFDCMTWKETSKGTAKMIERFRS